MGHGQEAEEQGAEWKEVIYIILPLPPFPPASPASPASPHSPLPTYAYRYF